MTEEGAAASDLLGGISEADLATTIRVVAHLGANLDVFRSRPLKPLRAAIHPIVEEQLRKMPDAGGRERGRKRGRPGDGGGGGGGIGGLLDANDKSSGRLDGLSPKERMKQMDRDSLNMRLLRAERRDRLEQMYVLTARRRRQAPTPDADSRRQM